MCYGWNHSATRAWCVGMVIKYAWMSEGKTVVYLYVHR